MLNYEQIELAMKVLKVSEDEIREYSFDLDNTDAVYISIPKKGGDSLIISTNGELLYANSSVSFDTHLKEFLAGRRTPLNAFE